MSTTATWFEHEFTVYDPETTNWKEVGGLYIFAGLVKDQLGNSRWRAYYIGKTGDFADRLPTHENWPEAQRLGATHVHALVEGQALRRAKIELDLVRLNQPPLNVQLK